MPTASLDPDTTLARRYVDALCTTLALPPLAKAITLDEHPAGAWARSGLMALTGDDEPQLCIAPVVSAAQAVLATLASLAPDGVLDELDAAKLLGERAALMGTSRAGATSPGGACHLIAAADGWLAVNLARDDDWALIPAWLEIDDLPDLARLQTELLSRRTDELLERARWLGLAVALEQAPRPAPWCQRLAGPGWRGGGTPRRRPRVVDLSSLWAGPLCSHILHKLGAEVIKVEGWQRPDGARRGNVDFFNRLHAGKQCVALDWGSAEGVAQLRALLGSADIVIEGSRPRALQQLGIDASAIVAAKTDLTWLSVTGCGRTGPEADWVAFGDDAGVAAGLSWLMREQTGRSLMVGDALADPVTGLHAALAAWASWCDGGSRLLSLSLVDTLRHAVSFELPSNAAGRRARHADWQAHLNSKTIPIVAASARPVHDTAAALGADNAAVLGTLTLSC
jgi:hypothetical protein